LEQAEHSSPPLGTALTLKPISVKTGESFEFLLVTKMPLTEQILLGYGVFLLVAFVVAYIGLIAYSAWLMWQALKQALPIGRLPSARLLPYGLSV
jgi:hypothetical protein